MKRPWSQTPDTAGIQKAAEETVFSISDLWKMLITGPEPACNHEGRLSTGELRARSYHRRRPRKVLRASPGVRGHVCQLRQVHPRPLPHPADEGHLRSEDRRQDVWPWTGHCAICAGTARRHGLQHASGCTALLLRPLRTTMSRKPGSETRCGGSWHRRQMAGHVGTSTEVHRPRSHAIIWRCPRG